MPWFGLSDIDLAAELRSINNQLRSIVTSIEGVRADYRNWGQALIDQKNAALALAEAATAKAKENADALAQFQADDAATDLQQLADQQAQDAQGFADDLAALKEQDTPTEPSVPGGDQPQDVPPVDQPADGGDTPPVDVPPADETEGGDTPAARARGKRR